MDFFPIVIMVKKEKEESYIVDVTPIVSDKVFIFIICFQDDTKQKQTTKK